MNILDDLIHGQKGRGHLVDALALVLREDEAGAASDGPDSPYSLVVNESLEDIQVWFGEVL